MEDISLLLILYPFQQLHVKRPCKISLEKFSDASTVWYFNNALLMRQGSAVLIYNSFCLLPVLSEQEIYRLH